jgi:hypothetical protein
MTVPTATHFRPIDGACAPVCASLGTSRLGPRIEGALNTPTYALHQHVDIGPLRAPARSPDYEAWTDGAWHTITVDMTIAPTPITEEHARDGLKSVDLYAPNAASPESLFTRPTRALRAWCRRRRRTRSWNRARAS